MRGFGVFGRGLKIRRGVDAFEDLDSGYEKGGDVDVFGGMGCVEGNIKRCKVRGLICFRERTEMDVSE